MNDRDFSLLSAEIIEHQAVDIADLQTAIRELAILVETLFTRKSITMGETEKSFILNRIDMVRSLVSHESIESS